MATVDSLVIEVSTSADKAAKDLNELSASLSSVEGAVDSLEPKLKTAVATFSKIANIDFSALKNLQGVGDIKIPSVEGEFKGTEQTFSTIKEYLADYYNDVSLVCQAQTVLIRGIEATSTAMTSSIETVKEYGEALGKVGGNITINNVNGVTGDLSAFQQTMQGLGTAITALTTKVNALGSAAKKNAKKATTGATQATKHTSKLLKTVSGISTAFSKLGKALVRVAVYRALRSVIKEITEAFKEGKENIYQWDKAVGGISGISSAFDRAATAAQYLKNSIAAALSPVLSAFGTTLDGVVDKIVSFINVIGRMLAKISGKSTYIKAKKQLATYADTASDATESVQELKRELLGIDEINILGDTSTSSSGSSSGSSVNYADMFEVAELDLSNTENLFADVIDLAKTAITALFDDGIGIEEIKACIEKIKLDWSNCTIDEKLNVEFASAGTVAGGAVGFILTGSLGGAVVGSIAGITLGLIFSSAFLDYKNATGISDDELLAMIKGAFGTGAIGAAIGATIGTAAASAAGTVIGAIIGFTLCFTFSLIVSDDEQNGGEFSQKIKDITEFFNTISEYIENPSLIVIGITDYFTEKYLEIVDAVADWIAKSVEKMINLAGDITEKLDEIKTAVADWIADKAEKALGLKDKFTSSFNKIKTAVAEWIKEKFSCVLDFASNFETFKTNLLTLWNELMDTLKEKTGWNIFDKLKVEISEEKKTKAQQEAAKCVDTSSQTKTIKKYGESAGNAYHSGIVNYRNTATTTPAESTAYYLNTKKWSSKITDFGKSAGSDFASGIRDYRDNSETTPMKSTAYYLNTSGYKSTIKGFGRTAGQTFAES